MLCSCAEVRTADSRLPREGRRSRQSARWTSGAQVTVVTRATRSSNNTVSGAGLDVLCVPTAGVSRGQSTVRTTNGGGTDGDCLVVRYTSCSEACSVVGDEALLVEQVGEALAKLDTCSTVTVAHGYTPEDAGLVEFDLEVSVVWHRQTAENSRVS